MFLLYKLVKPIMFDEKSVVFWNLEMPCPTMQLDVSGQIPRQTSSGEENRPYLERQWICFTVTVDLFKYIVKTSDIIRENQGFWVRVCVCVCYLWYVVYISYPNFANQPHLPSSSCQGQEESQPVAGSCRQEEMCSWHVFWSWNCGQVKWVILSCGLECILNTIPIPK